MQVGKFNLGGVGCRFRGGEVTVAVVVDGGIDDDGLDSSPLSLELSLFCNPRFLRGGIISSLDDDDSSPPLKPKVAPQPQ